MNRDQLLQRMREICYNDDEDVITMAEWESLTVDELRTVVALLDDGGAELIANATTSRRTRRGSCYLLRGLWQWISERGTNPRTRQPITSRQRAVVARAYRRLTGSTHVPNNNDPSATQNTEVPLFSPLHAPRTQSSPQFFSSVQGTGRRRPVLQALHRDLSRRQQHFDGRTIIRINGQRLTTADSVTLSVTRARVDGRDAFTMTIDTESP